MKFSSNSWRWIARPFHIQFLVLSHKEISWVLSCFVNTLPFFAVYADALFARFLFETLKLKFKCKDVIPFSPFGHNLFVQDTSYLHSIPRTDTENKGELQFICAMFTCSNGTNHILTTTPSHQKREPVMRTARSLDTPVDTTAVADVYRVRWLWPCDWVRRAVTSERAAVRALRVASRRRQQKDAHDGVVRIGLSLIESFW